MQHRADYNFIVKYGEISADGVAVFDLNSRRFVYLNRFLGQIFEGESDALLNDASAILNLVHPEDLTFVEHRYRELLSIGCIPPTEFRIVAGGLTKHVSCEVLWLEESYTFALFARDTTSSSEHDNYALKYTARKDALLDILIQKLSLPLQQQHALWQANSGGDTDQLNHFRDNAEQCIALISGFLTEALEASAETALKSSRFDIGEKIEVLLDLFRELHGGKRFVLNISMENRNLNADPLKFLQVMQQVLSNAVKFTPEDGHISVDVSEDKEWLDIKVKDNGSGIPPALLPLLTKQHVLGSQGLNGEKSSGAGLFLSARLSEIMRGSLRISSVEQEGTTVHLRFPRE